MDCVAGGGRNLVGDVAVRIESLPHGEETVDHTAAGMVSGRQAARALQQTHV